jgi:hypothetical protein
MPLIGGFIFSKCCVVTRFACAREEGHRLYFRAGFYAVFLFGVAVLLRDYLLGHSELYLRFEGTIERIVTPFLEDSNHAYQIPLSLVCIYAMVLGWPVAKLLNLPLRKTYFLEKALADNPIEGLLYWSVVNEKPVAVTMDNRKVYIGYIVETPDPEKETKAISILPLASGYRTKESSKLVITTDYESVYRQAEDDQVDASADGEIVEEDLEDEIEEGEPDPDDFVVILPVNRVHSLNLFDFTVYAKFQEQPPTHPIPSPDTDEDAKSG